MRLMRPLAIGVDIASSVVVVSATLSSYDEVTSVVTSTPSYGRSSQLSSDSALPKKATSWLPPVNLV